MNGLVVEYHEHEWVASWPHGANGDVIYSCSYINLTGWQCQQATTHPPLDGQGHCIYIPDEVRQYFAQLTEEKP